MQKQFYFQSPVEVVKVNKDNLEEVAEWCGGKVLSCDSKHRPGTLDYYVWVPTPKGNGTSCAFPGMYVAKRLMNSAKGEQRTSWGVFRRDFFEKNYYQSSEKAQKIWGTGVANGPKPAPPKKETNLGEAVEEKLKENHIQAPEELFRSAETGQFVSEEFAQENPSTTVREEIPNASSEMVPTLGDLSVAVRLNMEKEIPKIISDVEKAAEEAIEEAQNKKIDEIHGAGAAEALDEAIKDGSIFNQ